MIKKLLSIVVASAALCFTACSDDNGNNAPVSLPVGVSVILPSDISTSAVSDERFTFTNLSNGEKTVFTSVADIKVLPGMYDIAYSAVATVHDGVTVKLQGLASSVQILSDTDEIKIEVFATSDTDDLIIAEIFYTGTQQTSGNGYIGDNYIKLYNNTDHVVYADGLAFFETKFTSVQKYDYTPDIMGEAVSIDAIYVVPGDGTKFPVNPGEYFTIADVAIDHRNLNPLSFDLGKADAEWYDETSNPTYNDIDNPDVPNLDKWYCYTNSYFILHNRGLKSYGIARVRVDRDTYLADYKYDYTYNMVLPTGTFAMSGNAYRMPNEWVVDMVNLSVASVHQWLLSSPALDMGYAYCGTIDRDPDRFFKSVRRRVSGMRADGTPLLADTNNSSVDFNSSVVASEIELQGTAINVTGQKATTITWDGVTPRTTQN